jgi:glycosyltransferase involved in cell wall biosynthesis
MFTCVSIIVPCFNHGKFLDDLRISIESSRISVSYETIIINDGSTDKFTLDKLFELEKLNYKIIHQHNQGLAVARNNAIRVASGKYILPLDSDNKLCSGFIEKSIHLLENNSGYDIIYSNAKYFGERDGIWEVGEFNLQRMMLKPYIDACAIFKKEMWLELGGYDEKMPVMGLEDWDLWLRAACNGYNFYYLQTIGFEYRVLSNSMIRSYNLKQITLLSDYMAKTHSKYLGIEHISNYIISRYKNNNRLLIKLLIAVKFPRLFNFLLNLKVFEKKEII